MATRRAPIILAMLVVAACQPETVSTTTVSVAPPSTTMPIASTTTTTALPAIIDICSRGVVWDAGATYVADCFARPLSFQPQEQGWVSGGASGGHVLLRWTDPDDREREARIAFIIYAASLGVSDVLDRIAMVEGIAMTDPAQVVDVAGWPGVTAGLEGGPEENVPAGYPPCTIGDAVWFPVGKFGHGFFELMSRVVGVGACQVVQAWAIDVNGLTVTVLAGTEDPENHQVAIDAAERLFAFMNLGPTS